MSGVPGRFGESTNAGGRVRTRFALVPELLALDVDPSLRHAVVGWLPRDAAEVTDSRPFRARIDVSHGEAAPSFEFQTSKPALTLNGVPMWMQSNLGTMHREGSGVHGRLDLETAHSEIRVISAEGALQLAGTTRDPDADVSDVHQMLLISAAFLLQRAGAAVIHAAAVIPSGDAAWLLVGDSHAGKSTTTLNLIRGGWDYLSDDQVVITPAADDRLQAFGWQRAFHLDAGWNDGESVGRRSDIEPESFGPGTRRAFARVAGVITLALAPDQPTVLSPIASSEALTLMIRQSPWFLADRLAAKRALGLLSRTATLPSYSLRLGADVYRDSARLLQVLAPLADAGSAKK